MRQSIFSYKNNVNEYFYTEHRNAAKMITTITYCRNVIAGLCTNSSYTQKANNHTFQHTTAHIHLVLSCVGKRHASNATRSKFAIPNHLLINPKIRFGDTT